jgi:hypothetical protein
VSRTLEAPSRSPYLWGVIYGLIWVGACTVSNCGILPF